MAGLSRRLLALLLVPVLAVAGCVASEATDDRSGPTARSTTKTGLALAPQAKAIRTVQLYRTGDETNLPVVVLDESGTLTLAFDLMAEEGRPLTVSFHHADRTWTRDLSPSRVLETYHDDRLSDYESSLGTTLPYVHYTYKFPNDDIQFQLSGNYILRVTERGQRDSVLFERPFFVSEQTGRLQAGGEAFAPAGQQQPSVRPVARFDPPPELSGNAVGYAACFVRNGRVSDVRCQDRAQLARPQLGFELSREEAFAPTTANYTVDLGNLRAGNSIMRTDRTRSPIQVLLEPDYAQFGGGGDFEASLNGQIVVTEAVRGRSEPALSAEYVETTFAFVPPNEQPLTGGVLVTGSFSGMDPARGIEMEWQPDRSQYEGTVLLKQGRYQYFYQSPDARLERTLRSAQSRFRNSYATFLYYRDVSRGTDRLLRVGTFAQ